jgi:hypothetical protein
MSGESELSGPQRDKLQRHGELSRGSLFWCRHKITRSVAKAETAFHTPVLMSLSDIGWIIVVWAALAVLTYLGSKLLGDLTDHWRK